MVPNMIVRETITRPAKIAEMHPTDSESDAGRDGGAVASIDLAKTLEGLCQTLCTRGGIRPPDAAVGELAKLLLLRIAAEREPSVVVSGFGILGNVLDGGGCSVQMAKAAFCVANTLPALSVLSSSGAVQSVWPLDEPLRITREDVLSEAMGILGGIDLGQVGAYDPMGTAFNIVLRGGYEHAGGAGTYLTPRALLISWRRSGSTCLHAPDSRAATLF